MTNEQKLKDLKEAKNNLSANRLSLLHLLFVLFLGLKLAGLGVVASWSWWWVFAPIIVQVIMFGIAKSSVDKAIEKLEK